MKRVNVTSFFLFYFKLRADEFRSPGKNDASYDTIQVKVREATIGKDTVWRTNHASLVYMCVWCIPIVVAGGPADDAIPTQPPQNLGID